MKRIILHEGDKVTHNTLGEGTVTIVDEEYVTVRFVSDELTFRLPDAFEKGFLSSKVAIIEETPVDGKEEVAIDESEDKEERPKEEVKADEKKEKGGCSKALFIMMGMAGFLPFVVYHVWNYVSTGDSTDLLAAFLFVIGFILYLPFAIRLAKVSGSPSATNAGSGLDPDTELMAGIMGSELIHRSMEREKREAEKRRYDSLYWQESIRDKNPHHDFDYDHEDDWLGT